MFELTLKRHLSYPVDFLCQLNSAAACGFPWLVKDMSNLGDQRKSPKTNLVESIDGPVMPDDTLLLYAFSDGEEPIKKKKHSLKRQWEQT